MLIKDMEKTLAASVAEAVERLVSRCAMAAEEEVSLPEAAGRVLARDYYSTMPMPPFRRAAMDGYAVRAAQTAAASPECPLRLRTVREARAGDGRGANEARGSGDSFAAESSRLSIGMPERTDPSSEAIEAVRIFTGAPVPAGFDSIIMQEWVTESGETGAGGRIDRPAVPGQHIAEAGEDVRPGARLLARGRTVGAKETALLASFGYARVAVRRRPTVAVLPIGDELARPGEPLPPFHIYEANGYAVETGLRLWGAEVFRLAPAPDDPEAIHRRAEEAWELADLLVTTGGVSVGTYDYVPEAARRAGADALFGKVRMRPGTPTKAFARGEKLWVALSGNPSACYSGLELLVKPCVLAMAGSAGWAEEWAEGTLESTVAKPCPYPRYVRSRAWLEGGRYRVEPLGNDKSGNIAAFAEANALAEIPAGGLGARAGTTVRWMRLA